MSGELSCSQCYAESGIYFFHFYTGESANIVGEQRFTNTDQIITVNSTVVFKPFVNPYFNLSCKAIVFRINRRANDSRKSVINNSLSGNNKENALFLGVIFGTFLDPEKIAALHRSISWYESTSNASAFSLSAWSLNSSISLASDFSDAFADAGVNEIITDSVGISLGTSIISLRLFGIFTVWVMVMN